MRILVVEDNRRLGNALKMSLVDEGYAVDLAFDGERGEELAEVTPYDAIILDVMLPNRSGLEICRHLRQRRVNVPIIMLTARDAVEDRVMGLDSGADDYMVKPFALSELCARLRALMRRESSDKKGLLLVADLVADPATRFVERGGRAIDLTAKEYALLEYFIRHPNQVVTRDMIETHVWSYDFDCTSNVVDVYVRRLRRKVDEPFGVKLLETVRGVGYRLRDPARYPASKNNGAHTI